MSASHEPLKNLLLTGAAGALGRVLAPSLRGVCQRLITSDLAAALPALGDPDAVVRQLGPEGVWREDGPVLGRSSAMKDATKYANDIAKKENDDALEAVKKTGKTEIIVPTAEQKAAMKKALLVVHKDNESRVGKDTLRIEAYGTVDEAARANKTDDAGRNLVKLKRADAEGATVTPGGVVRKAVEHVGIKHGGTPIYDSSTCGHVPR